MGALDGLAVGGAGAGVMADGDRGGGEGGWDHAIPEVYDGRPLNPMPLAMALPSSYAPFNVMGRPALWHNAGEIGTKPAHPHPHRHSQPHPHAHAVWQAGPPTAPVAVAIPPVYFTNPPPMPPMAFPAASIKAEIPPPVTVRPAGAGVMALPPQTLHANHPHTNFPSGNLVFTIFHRMACIFAEMVLFFGFRISRIA